MDEKDQIHLEKKQMLDKQIKKLNKEIFEFKLYALCCLSLTVAFLIFILIDIFFNIPFAVVIGVMCFLSVLNVLIIVWKKRLKKLE